MSGRNGIALVGIVGFLACARSFGYVSFCYDPASHTVTKCVEEQRELPLQTYLLHPDALGKRISLSKCPKDVQISPDTCQQDRHTLLAESVESDLLKNSADRTEVASKEYQFYQSRIEAIQKKLNSGAEDAAALHRQLEKEKNNQQSVLARWRSDYQAWKDLKFFFEDKAMDFGVGYDLDLLLEDGVSKSAVETLFSLLRGGVGKPGGECTGAWAWDFQTLSGEIRRTVLKLQQHGTQVVGTISVLNGRKANVNGSFVEGNISLQVTRQFNGNRFVINYHGKMNGDTITGESEYVRDGESTSRPWTATRYSER